ncbi:MAG TPA: hypothetical protein VHH12_06275 [Mycobacterium sp.]|nr:hypothetical protein [Mycobacterium sp.]
MNIVRGATRMATQTASATTAAAGALGGAAVNGIIGGVQGTARGVRDGLSSGSHSTPAALLTMGAVGAAGLVEWPVLVTLGGAALLVRQLGPRDGGEARPSAVSAEATSPTATTPRRRATSAKPAAKPAAKRTTKPAAKRTTKATRSTRGS